ncbi:ARM repeat-containing protein [Cylindrobasidium torrendii FP15055 ss-10]|uniref:ARM repeat-containing protein n=1 Tax=Cylindrobasidium torrendii FP15055 ss-10 TaxID=1314674 RepID=A0A0D7B463_9AGAR|nr:ARM repeat-containing protein [Cylindrobasidium torrendii FP15055 ss-10]
MAEELLERQLFSAFSEYEDVLNYQSKLLATNLSVDPTSEEDAVEEGIQTKIYGTLASYQEQSYLLDPYLERLVVPVITTLKEHASLLVQNPSHPSSVKRVTRVSMLMYQYIKCRGSKTIIRFFPHEIADLSVVLGFMQLDAVAPDDPDLEQWTLRYVFLLWLSIICMLPFDLAQFDESEGDNSTSKAIEAIGKKYLSAAGLERHGAALVLSRLYMRKDTINDLRSFVGWTRDVVEESTDLFSIIGTLQILNELLKSAPAAQAEIVYNAMDALTRALDASVFISNTLVRKYRSKFISRCALRMLPPKIQLEEEEVDVPEEIETILEQLFNTLQDRDTVVRWSAAKSVARIAAALPADFSDQICSTVMNQFSIHSITAATIYDMPTIAENTWHGACLACAEMARRGLVRAELLPVLVDWVCKALYFDLRKGAHSIGSNVRDAAAYVIWSLPRSKEPSELAPFASRLAQKLVTVSLFDREIHIRRAASAAFQENVGRTGLFSQGIDVLRKTDFYAVSIRRNAFTVAAPQVAEHLEYRDSMLAHLLDISLRHWDINIRTLASESIQMICLKDMEALAPEVFRKASQLLESTDNVDIHGGLLALAQLSVAYKEHTTTPEERERHMQDIFQRISTIPHAVVVGPRSEIVTAAACELIAQTITVKELEDSAVPQWRKIVDHGIKHRSVVVQDAAANAMSALSSLVDCIPPNVFRQLVDKLLDGLDDYTTDERGDVGSWVRISCINGLTAIVEALVVHSAGIQEYELYFPPETYHAIVNGILKQGFERLDNVRHDSGECIQRFINLSPPATDKPQRWALPDADILRGLFVATDWADGSWLFPRAVQMLELDAYRRPVLLGLLASVGSRTESTHKPVSRSIVAHVKSLPRMNAATLVHDLLKHAKANWNANSTVLPVLQTLNILLEGGALEDLDTQTLEAMQALAVRSVDKIKNIQRIQEAMKIVAKLIEFPTIFDKCVKSLPLFLSHRFPSVRSETAEALYLVLQSIDIDKETDDIEEVLLETEWSAPDVQEHAQKVVDLFLAA